MTLVKLTSCMAPNADFICRDISLYIAERLSIQTIFINDITWQERERMLDEGEIDIGWICGLPYIQKVDMANANIELLAAPIIQGARYQNRPIYFSDIIVHRDSPYRSFNDLR